MIRQLDDRTLVSGQIAPHEVAGLAGQGVTVLVNNRPDGEEADQPLAGDIEAAAEAAGIAYRFVPIIRGIGPADVEAMQEALREAQGGKLLAFCRSGTRSAFATAIAHARRGGVSGRGDRAAQPGRVRPRPNRAFALGLVLVEEPNGVVEILIEDHHPDTDNRSVGIARALSVEDDRVDVMLLQENAEQLRLIGPVEPRRFDKPAHQGVTSPAASSAGRGLRPSIWLRCGKRPNRSITSR